MNFPLQRLTLTPRSHFRGSHPRGIPWSGECLGYSGSLAARYNPTDGHGFAAGIEPYGTPRERTDEMKKMRDAGVPRTNPPRIRATHAAGNKDAELAHQTSE